MKIYVLSETVTLQKLTILKWKRGERRFVDLRIILILHCGNEFLKEVLNFALNWMITFPDMEVL